MVSVRKTIIAINHYPKPQPITQNPQIKQLKSAHARSIDRKKITLTGGAAYAAEQVLEKVIPRKRVPGPGHCHSLCLCLVPGTGGMDILPTTTRLLHSSNLYSQVFFPPDTETVSALVHYPVSVEYHL